MGLQRTAQPAASFDIACPFDGLQRRCRNLSAVEEQMEAQPQSGEQSIATSRSGNGSSAIHRTTEMLKVHFITTYVTNPANSICTSRLHRSSICRLGVRRFSTSSLRRCNLALSRSL